MSGVSGKTRTNADFVKKTGFFEGQVMAINPDREKLEKILSTTLEKDPEYLGEDEGGVKKLNMSIWLKDVKTGEMKNVRFFLKDKPKQNTEKTKYQYINEVGATTWADKPENLPDWFKARAYRKANEGEEEMYNFMVNWLNKLDTRDAGTVLSFEWKKLINGNVKEITEVMGSEFEGTVVCLCVIRETEKDGEKKIYEQIYNREFMAGYMMKQIRLKKIDADFIKAAEITEKKKRTKLQKFVLAVTDSQYGIKDYFTLGELEEYDPSKNVAASDKAHIKDDDASY